MVGKEFDTNAGLNLYDYHARQYEPAIGRFTTIDPMAENYYSISPYAYCANNSIKFIDPTGMDYTAENESQMADFMEYMSNGGDISQYSFNGWKQAGDDDPVIP